VHPEALMGLLMGGAVIYWFTGASTQAVVTGAYRAVVYIKENMKLDASTASVAASKEVVRICTQYAQKGMINIFVVVFCFALSLAFFDPYFFIGYLIGIAFFGLFQAIFMANAGGAWDNAKKIVEVELKQKGTPLHAATVVGDTVGDPFKDTSSVSLNPVIKFTTLFGLLAVEIAVKMDPSLKLGLGAAIFAGRPRLRVPQLLLDADPRGLRLGARAGGERALDPDGLGDDLAEDRRQPGAGGVAPARGRDDEARGDPVGRVEQPPAPPEVGLEAGVEVHGLEPDRVAADVARRDRERAAERDRQVGVVAADALARLPDVPGRGLAVRRARACRRRSRPPSGRSAGPARPGPRSSEELPGVGRSGRSRSSGWERVGEDVERQPARLVGRHDRRHLGPLDVDHAEYLSSKGPVRASTAGPARPSRSSRSPSARPGAHTIASETSCCCGSVLTRTLKVNAALGATTW
jgi:hypothetical protein